jgi:uncharacterized iron-regulated membrane protein
VQVPRCLIRDAASGGTIGAVDHPMSKSRFPILLYRWHAWVGLLSGLFLIVICTTGSIAVFRPEIERALDYSGHDFTVVPTGDAAISAERAVKTAEAKYPGARAQSVRFPALAGSTQFHGDAYLVQLNQGRGKGNVSVLVDPYRRTVIAALKPVRGWGDFVRQLHVRFFYGSFWGRYIVGLFGLTLLFSTISGLIVFTRFNGGSWKPKPVRWGRGGRIVTGDLHKLVGLGTVAFNIIFGVSGAVLGLEGIYHKFIAEKTAPAKHATVARLPEGRIDDFVRRAQELVPGGQPSAIVLGHARNGTVRVDLWPTTAHLVREQSSYVVFDAKTSQPAEIYDVTKAAAGVRLYYAMEPLHFGRLGGAMWVKLLWGLMGLSGGFLSVTGFVIYVLRKRQAKSCGRVTAEERVVVETAPAPEVAAVG